MQYLPKLQAVRLLGVCLFIFSVVAGAWAEDPYQIAWTRHVGMSGSDQAYCLAIDRQDNIYLAGNTTGALNGTNAGGADAFLCKYNVSGDLNWTQQYGTSGQEYTHGVTTDSSGNIYMTGEQGTDAAGWQAFLLNYDSAGNRLATNVFGTAYLDRGRAAAVVAGPQGAIYVAGDTWGDMISGSGPGMGNCDAFVSKFATAGGSPQWTRECRTPLDDCFRGAAVDTAGNLYVAGGTKSVLAGSSAGGEDAFIAKYDSSGNQTWIRQLGWSGDDRCLGIALDAAGNVYTTGWSCPGSDQTTPADIFLAKHDSAGNLLAQPPAAMRPPADTDDVVRPGPAWKSAWWHQ